MSFYTLGDLGNKCNLFFEILEDLLKWLKRLEAFKAKVSGLLFFLLLSLNVQIICIDACVIIRYTMPQGKRKNSAINMLHYYANLMGLGLVTFCHNIPWSPTSLK